MKVKEYFKEAFKSFARSVSMFGKGVWYGAKRLFCVYPNPTWVVITALLAMASVVRIGEARAERDAYGKENAQLQHQLDSLQGKEIRYMGYKE